MKFTIDLPNDVDSFTIEYNGAKQLIHIKNEEWIPAKAYKVKKICPKCGGEMVVTSEVLLTSPTQYQHKCIDCGYKKYYLKKYPYIDYKEEE